MHSQDKSGGNSRRPSSSPRVARFILPDAQKEILRQEFHSGLHGILSDLRIPHALRDPVDNAREGEVFRRLLAALDGEEIVVPDEEAKERIDRLAASYDEMEAHEEVATTHDAHEALIRFLGGEGCGAPEDEKDEPSGNPGPGWDTDDPDDCGREVLDLLLREAPDCLSFGDVAVALAGDPDDWHERDALRSAIAVLVAAGLVRRQGGALAPSRTARQMADLGFCIG
jgi:hypothetical protein